MNGSALENCMRVARGALLGSFWPYGPRHGYVVRVLCSAEMIEKDEGEMCWSVVLVSAANKSVNSTIITKSSLEISPLWIGLGVHYSASRQCEE